MSTAARQTDRQTDLIKLVKTIRIRKVKNESQNKINLLMHNVPKWSDTLLRMQKTNQHMGNRVKNKNKNKRSLTRR